MADRNGNPSGKKKWSLNERTQLALRRFEAAGFCPVKEAIEVYSIAKEAYENQDGVHHTSEGVVDNNHQYLKLMADVCKSMMPYAFPKLKQIELTGDDDKPIRVAVTRDEVMQALKADPFMKVVGEEDGQGQLLEVPASDVDQS
jgi:hypothetical protein